MTTQNIIKKTFLDIATGLESGSFGGRPKIAVTGIGSEHGEQNILDGAISAAARGVDVTYIGTLSHPSLTCVHADSEETVHAQMETLLSSGEVQGAVTMHYPFPVGVSTVGRVATPATGREMFIACTTGMASTNRAECMVKNALYGIIAAKSCGIANPTVGILNIDGARTAEGLLRQLAQGGYDITFASSGRSDGGCVMRGNDALTGACDVLVTDSLTGNILMKMLSAFTTGGGYESTGYGYGPGIGGERLVNIISRASGSPVVARAIVYAADLARGDWNAITKAELATANKAGLAKILESTKKSDTPQSAAPAAAPPKEVVTKEINGIEVTELDDAVAALWAVGIYAESGMGCTGPIVLVSEANLEKAREVMVAGKYAGN
ncbi:MAG: glycine/sarcosine/betaine reductase complex component C subunit alpha [Oscillospiraceae bacterium]|nr:glycine/sarcosine/betaine reductase complex component C subunit alpha [Oscillospiraceae bacterium]